MRNVVRCAVRAFARVAELLTRQEASIFPPSHLPTRLKPYADVVQLLAQSEAPQKHHHVRGYLNARANVGHRRCLFVKRYGG
jgi:hypothetical protein